MLTKLRLLSTAGALIALTSAGALADNLNPSGTYMGTSLTAQPAPVQTVAPVQTAQAMPGYVTSTVPNHYSPYGAASQFIDNAAPEGSGTNPYLSGVGTSGHAPGR